MRIVSEPEIYIVGRQTLDDAEVQRFLEDHQTSWQTDSERGSELIVELAGRTCYLSLGDRQFRKTNADYIGNLINQGHGSVLEHAVWDLLITGVSRSLTHELVRHRAGTAYCLAGDTLIDCQPLRGRRRNGRNSISKQTIKELFELTKIPHGRSRLQPLRLRCLDQCTGLFTTGQVKQVTCSGLKPVFRVELQDGKSITCTKEHRFLTREGWQSLEDLVGGVAVTDSGMAVYGSDSAEVMVNGVPAYSDPVWLRERYSVNDLDHATMAQLAGVSPHTIRAWIRKHHIQKPRGSGARGDGQQHQGKPYRPRWRRLTGEARRLVGQQWDVAHPRRRGGNTLNAIHGRRGGIKDSGSQVREGDQYSCYLCGNTRAQLTVHHVPPSWTCPDPAVAVANVVSLCRACQAQVNAHEEGDTARFGRTKVDVSQRQRPTTERVRRVTAHPVHIKALTYAGEQMTYDIEMEDPHHNFVANGIVTHNSQLSQRYVDESTADFIEPPVIAGDPELHAVWLRSVEVSHHAYQELVEGLAQRVHERFPSLPRTQRLKMAREAARSVLPNATETKLLFSANARALRWIITLRGGEGAEPEIRRLAIKLCRVMQREAPNLFSDLEIVQLNDGTEGVRAQHNKV
jgi:thymidylate synthase (FAD)